MVSIVILVVGVAADAAETTRHFPVGAPPAAILDVVDLHEADEDTKLSAITLQGLVNREGHASVFFLLFDTDVYPSLFWLEQLRRKGYIEGTKTLSVEEYFEKYLDRAEGLVLYDLSVPATLNVATMIASLESRMVVSPDDVGKYADKLPDISDLRGRWQTNAAAYAWAFEELWPRLRHDILAVYHPTHTKHHLRDYLVSNRVFTFWVTGEDHDEAAFADHDAERQVAQEVLAASPSNIPIIGWWGAEEDPGLSEYGGVGWAGEYGKLTVGCNWQTNLSLLSGIPVDVDAVMGRFRKRKEAAPSVETDGNKVYISYVVMESGDSPTYWQHIQKRVWDDPKRGTIPIGWTITPTLFETLPSVGEWFLDQAKPNDHFVLALSGWGYCHPYRDFMAKTVDPEAAWRAYLETTGNAMHRLGITDLGLYTDAWRPFRRAERDDVTRRFTEGIPGLRLLILGMGRDDEITESSPHYCLGDTVVSHVFTRWDAENIGRSESNNEWLANEIRERTPAARPAFMFVHPLSWSYYPSDLVDITERLGEDYVAVSPGVLSGLVRASQDQS